MLLTGKQAIDDLLPGAHSAGNATVTVPANGFSISCYLSIDVARNDGDILLAGKCSLPGLASRRR